MASIRFLKNRRVTEMVKETKEDNLLSRWSRRKLEAKSQSETPLEENQASLQKTPLETPVEDEPPDPILEENRLAAEAVDLEALDYESDFSVFMKEGVPDALKRQAFKTLWRSSPILANVDGLVDYDDDFASPDLIMKTFDSAWKIGKGYFEDEQPPDEPAEMKVEAETEPSNEEHNENLETAQEEISEETDDQIQDNEELTKTEDVEPQHLVKGSEETDPHAQPQKVSLRKRLMMDS